MLTSENILFLKQKNPNLYEQLKQIETTPFEAEFRVADTKNNHKTLTYTKNGENYTLHSLYNPQREAEQIVQKFIENQEISQNTHVIFFGLGLGYHIKEFLTRYPNVSFSIFEPSLEVLYHFFSNISIQSLPTKNLQSLSVENTPEDVGHFVQIEFSSYSKKTLLFPLPIYQRLYDHSYQKFLSIIQTKVKQDRGNLHSNYAFQKRWILNSIMNFPQVLNTPNILQEKGDYFTGKPAVLISAGPSLNYEIEHLKIIHEKRLAYLFSVGSAINTLIDHDIYPDAVCSYDPTEINQKVFKKMNDRNIIDVPMIFGTSIGYEVLQQFKGPKLHMTTSQDTLSHYYLEQDQQPENLVSDAPSIAVVTLELLLKLGFSTVILVGQNLAFFDGELYAKGVDYAPKSLTEEESQNLIKVPDVHGNTVYTSDGFNRMRHQFEYYVKSFSNLKVINTTRGGAHIEGTQYMPMPDVMHEYLHAPTANLEISALPKTQFFPKARLLEKINQMEQEHVLAKKTLQQLRSILFSIEKLANNQNFQQLETMYPKVDASYQKLKENLFSKVFLLPLNRVKIGIYEKEIANFRFEKNPRIKATHVVEIFQKILNSFQSSMDDMEVLFPSFHALLHRYIQNEDILNCNLLDMTQSNESKTPQNQPEEIDIKEVIQFFQWMLGDSKFNLSCTPHHLLNLQKNAQGEFMRFDISSHLYALSQNLIDQKNGLFLYPSIQKSLNKPTDLENLQTLCTSMQEKGFLEEFPILVNHQFQIIDGSQRLACAIFLNISKIPLRIEPKKCPHNYSNKWLSSMVLSLDSIQELESFTKRILETNPSEYCAIK